MKKYYCILIILTLFSCGNKKEAINLLEGNKISLERFDSLYFELDSFSTNRNLNSQLFFRDSVNFFTFLNEKNNTIYFYEVSSPFVKNKVALEKEGSSGVGMISSYFFSNLDSIFVYSYGGARLYLVDSSLKVVKNFFVEGDEMSVRPEVNSSRPLFKIGNKIGFNSWGSQKEYYNNTSFEENSFMFLDIVNGEKSYQISYPDVYKGAIWGVQFFQSYHEFNFKDSLLILSFPIDNDLTVFRINSGEYSRVEINGINDIAVEPLSYQMGKITPNIMEEVKHQMGQDYYSLIKYDSINGIYIRVLNKRFNDKFIDSFSGIGSVFGEYSLIFLDEKFNYIDEIDLPSNKYY